jgi:hypothetical protein
MATPKDPESLVRELELLKADIQTLKDRHGRLLTAARTSVAVTKAGPKVEESLKT